MFHLTAGSECAWDSKQNDLLPPEFLSVRSLSGIANFLSVKRLRGSTSDDIGLFFSVRDVCEFSRWEGISDFQGCHFEGQLMRDDL
jgi:hypothetical protein